MKRFLAGIFLGLIFIPIVGMMYIRLGLMPVATSESPLPGEKYIARTALHARIRKEAPRQAPYQPDETAFLDGARIYKQNCAFCHGLLKSQTSLAARGMFPYPPQLLQGDDRVTDDPVGITYWKVKNGIRLSGMPGFGESLSDREMWDVSWLLAKADKLSAAVQQELDK